MRKRLSWRKSQVVSLKDIAKHCGVSVATVSKVLNGRSDIGEATRSRVLSAAAEMGYTANAAARALKTNRSYSLGIVFSDLQNSGFMHEYFASMLNYFRIEAEKFGYDICFINNKVGRRKQTYLQHVLYRGIDGVALICADFQDPDIQELACSSLPTVTLDHVFNNRTAVLSDNMRGIISLVHFAYEKGHRKIAYIHGNNTAVTESRMTGFYKACEELQLSIPEEYVSECEYHEPNSCYQATKKLLSLRERPSCILFSDDYAYIGGLTAIKEAGLRIPEDISVAGYDGIPITQSLRPQLTTIHQDSTQMGRLAAEQLIRVVRDPRSASKLPVILPVELIEGGTIGKI